MTDAVYLKDIKQRSGFMTVWEKHRHRDAHWLVELFAEAVSPSLCHGILVLNHVVIVGCVFLLVIRNIFKQLKSRSHAINLPLKLCRSARYAGLIVDKRLTLSA
jgi:hypothetical protein